MSIQSIASKFRRSLRNRQGANFTAEQMQLMAEKGILSMLSGLEVEELCNQLPANKAQRVTTDDPIPTNAGFATLDRNAIAALTKGC